MNRNYFTKDNSVCAMCKQIIRKVGIHCYCWTKKQCIEEAYCIRCYNKIKTNFIVLEKKTVIFVEECPDDSLPVLNTPPVLTNSKDLTVFEAADKQLSDEVVKDNTKYSGRPDGSWVGLQIGCPDMKLIAAKDKELTITEKKQLIEKIQTDHAH